MTFTGRAPEAGVGLVAAAAIVAVVDGKATSGFPDKSNQKRLGSVRTARRARPRTLARYVIGRVFWMARRRGRSRFVTDAQSEPIRLEIRSDRPSEKLMLVMTDLSTYGVY
jgi:hypothetical protein